MGKECELNLKSVFLPFLSTSHIIPLVDMARLFAMHGVDVTIITTPGNATVFQKSVDLDSTRGRSIRTHLVNFPAAQVGLPPGIETFNVDTPPEMVPRIYMGLAILQPCFEQLFHDLRPDFIVTDMFHPWTVEAAAKLRIPRIMFHCTNYLALSAGHAVEQYAPHLAAKSDSDRFVLPGLPDRLEMTRLQLPDWLRSPNHFYDLESAYYEHYKVVMGTKSWGIGPVSLWANQEASDKAARGHAKEEDEEEEGWHKWLSTKAESSVLYVSFGSMNRFPYSQLVEIAHALEDSGKDFIWVLLILENPAIGGLVTHCGWNTLMESVNAGLPMVTWPLFAEQFYNEKLVVDVLKIGVSVGAKEWRNWNQFGSEVVKREDIGNAIGVMMSEESEELRRRAKTLSDAAKRAIQNGGSSHNNMKELIRELNQIKLSKAQKTTPTP
ncbi:hypothetical protein ACSQ67_002642 [Phaseolus vulgaris]